MRKTNPFTRCLDHFPQGDGFFAGRVLGAFVILVQGISICGAEPFSIIQTNENPTPSMTAWESNAAGERRKPSGPMTDITQPRWHMVLWFKDRGVPWDPWRTAPLKDQSSFVYVSDSSSPAFSLPADISDAALELQSIPIDEDVPAGIPSWYQSQKDRESATPFSENTDIPAPLNTASAQAGESGGNPDFSVPDAIRGPAKVEFSSADSESLRSDSAHDPGNLSAAPDGLPLNPPDPGNPLILSPEPSVTALLGISAFIFAWRYHRRAAKR